MTTAGATARRTLTIGTRGSKLALAQTELVRRAVHAAHPQLALELLPITTKGDQLRDRPLAAIGDRGLFVAEIEAALRAGRIDLAVHSAKDLPSRLPADMCIGAFLPRADARDVLVSSAGPLAALPLGARVGTSSPRRACQLRALRPDLTIVDVRGNVDTRLRKWRESGAGGVILAGAGLARLGLEGLPLHPLDPDLFLPAPCQGTLALETHAGSPAEALCAALDHTPTARAAAAERRTAALAAIENLRLTLLRVRSGLGTPDESARELAEASALAERLKGDS